MTDRRADRDGRGPAGEDFPRRLAAYIVDMAVCFALLRLMRLAAPDIALFREGREDIARNALFSVYMFLSHLPSGRSLGKRIAGLAVVSADGSRADVFRLSYREFLGRLLIEKANLIVYTVLRNTGRLDALRAGIANPLWDTLFTALVSLPWLTFVSFAFAFARPDGRALHDLVSGTRVVRASRRDLPARAGKKTNDRRRPRI